MSRTSQIMSALSHTVSITMLPFSLNSRVTIKQSVHRLPLLLLSRFKVTSIPIFERLSSSYYFLMPRGRHEIIFLFYTFVPHGLRLCILNPPHSSPMSVEALSIYIILPQPLLLHHCCSSRTPDLVILTNHSDVWIYF
jgi:hypothetical protein